MHNGCSPAAKRFVRQMKRRYLGMFRQKLVDGFPQLPDAFAVDDAHAQNPARPTLRQIIPHQRLHLPWLKGVQVQHAINRQLDGLVVHSGI